MLVGCASRSLHVYDVDAQRLMAEIRDAHPRAPHCLAMATPSPSASLGAAADLFISAAICDGAKLWDLRQTRWVGCRAEGRSQSSRVPCPSGWLPAPLPNIVKGVQIENQ